MIRNLVKDNLFLSKISSEATMLDKSVGQDLLDTLKFYQSTCVGMAANMIGVNKRIIAINDNGKYILMYNPVIKKESGKIILCNEGCLCHNGSREVKRYEKIQVSYLNESFKLMEKTFSGFSAEIIQHEVDHCNGILI